MSLRALDCIVDLVVMNKPPATRSGWADTETYVHRSGRTGRAGRKGTCVTLYQLKHRDTLREIERATRNTFDWVARAAGPGRPGRGGTPGSNERRGRRPGALPCFSDEAATLATFFGSPEKAVQARLAKIAGYEAGKPPDRSLLTNTENYVTCLYAAGLQIHSISYVWNFLRQEPPARRLRRLQGHAARRRLGRRRLRRAGEAQGAARGPRTASRSTCRTCRGSRSARPSPRAGAAAGAAAAGPGPRGRGRGKGAAARASRAGADGRFRTRHSGSRTGTRSPRHVCDGAGTSGRRPCLERERERESAPSGGETRRAARRFGRRWTRWTALCSKQSTARPFNRLVARRAVCARRRRRPLYSWRCAASKHQNSLPIVPIKQSSRPP